MTVPETPAAGQKPAERAVGLLPVVLRHRADFLRAAQGLRQGTAGFLLQARQRGDDEPPALLRIGFTASKKTGNAVIRNRARRRLREIARAVLPGHGRTGWDYVLVARPDGTISRDFAEMKADLLRALERIHATAARP